VLTLRKGFNLVSFPAETFFYGTLKNLMEDIGGSAVISKVFLLDPAANTFTESGYDSAGRFYGSNMVLLPGSGLDGMIVYAWQDHSTTFTSMYCRAWAAQPGVSLTGSGCVEPGTTAFSVLQDIGSELGQTSIQRFNTGSGRFETANRPPDSDPMGIDFPIVPGEGYFLYIK
jgi:hypothetical protein